MNERDYIDATDLRTIDIAKDALRHIVSANQPMVPEREYHTVMGILRKWRDTISAAVEKRADEEQQ